MKYEKVADKDGEKSILFSKNGKSIPIDKLSTGEKQVVFRGIFTQKYKCLRWCCYHDR